MQWDNWFDWLTLISSILGTVGSVISLISYLKIRKVETAVIEAKEQQINKIKYVLHRKELITSIDEIYISLSESSKCACSSNTIQEYYAKFKQTILFLKDYSKHFNNADRSLLCDCDAYITNIDCDMEHIFSEKDCSKILNFSMELKVVLSKEDYYLC